MTLPFPPPSDGWNILSIAAMSSSVYPAAPEVEEESERPSRGGGQEGSPSQAEYKARGASSQQNLCVGTWGKAAASSLRGAGCSQAHRWLWGSHASGHMQELP